MCTLFQNAMPKLLCFWPAILMFEEKIPSGERKKNQFEAYLNYCVNDHQKDYALPAIHKPADNTLNQRSDPLMAGAVI